MAPGMGPKGDADGSVWCKATRWLVVVGLYVLPAFSFWAAVSFFENFTAGFFASASVWTLFFCLLRVVESDKRCLGLWMITSLLVALLLMNPGTLAFLAWTVNGFAP